VASHASADAKSERHPFRELRTRLAAEEFTKQGSSLKLQPQPFKILAYLASRPGELITRQELRDHVWPGDTFVDFDLAINQAIKQIRAVLNDDAERPRVIATLPRRGYRFIAKAMPGAVAEASLPQVSKRRTRRKHQGFDDKWAFDSSHVA